MDLSFIPAIFELTGLYLLGKKQKIGFLFNMVGGVCWIIYSFHTHSAYGLVLVCGVALVLNVRGYLLWK